MSALSVKMEPIFIQAPLTNLAEKLSSAWKRTSLGKIRTTIYGSPAIKEICGFELFVRSREFGAFLKNAPKQETRNCSKTLENKGFNDMGSNPTMGGHTEDLTPLVSKKWEPRNSSNLPELANFSNYPSLVSARPDKPCILIGFDSEWENTESGREMLSWQFAVIWNSIVTEFIFIKTGTENLNINLALSCILEYIGQKSVDIRTIQRYAYCSSWDGDTPNVVVTDNPLEARANSVYVYRNNTFTHEKIMDMPDKCTPRGCRDWAWFHRYLDYSAVDSIRITLVCHTGKVDISSFDFSKGKNILMYLTDVQGGLVTLQPIRLSPSVMNENSHRHIFPISLSVSDTMCHSPAGMKKLKNLGEVVGIEKVDIPTECKEHMRNLLNEDPNLFFEYASTDSVVTLMYASAMYGYNNSLPVTVTSATASVMKEIMMKNLNCENTEEFNMKYRGLKKVKHGLVPREDRPGYIETTSLEPLNDAANTIQYYASQAYHGGYNSCSEIGYFPQETFDYDLQNAYPTAMCLVPDIDWQNPVRVEILRRNLDLRDWVGIGGINPITPFVGYVRFEFPKSVKFPCIPVNVDGIPVYPRTSNGLDGVYVAGPYIYLALKLGATVYCERGYFLNTLYNEDYTSESRSLSCAVKQLVMDRNKAKKECGKKSLEELILKTMVNSGYGKNAQNVVQKSSWTAFNDSMEELGCSAITNPVSAMMITSLVQVELLAAQNQMNTLGYVSCSVTTDGFISDCPENILKSMDLYGIRPFMESARIFLTGDPELWEAKHHQNDLINFTTRGNVSLLPHGVCAHNSTKSGFASDTFEDRLWLMTQVLGRTKTVDYVDNEWTTFKDLVHGKPFTTTPTTKHIRMDFDLKRKPDRSSFRSDFPIVDGVQYELAHFDTIPYEDIEEFRLYRQKKTLTEVLRTEADWDIFWRKLDLNSTGAKVRDMDWAILNTCIMGHRSGRWTIPHLTTGSVEERCEWINKHNSSKKRFKPSDWKNARRPERQVNMLPLALVDKKLQELMED